MIFQNQNAVNVAMFISRSDVAAMGADTLQKEEARLLALRELAGEILPHSLTIEAYENETGWMVFAAAKREPHGENTVWMRFDSADDFIDALAVVPAASAAEGWVLPKGGFAARFWGLTPQLTARLGEWGDFIRPPQGLEVFLREHRAC